ncbi:MAG: hypothetical protein QF893_02335 [Alphaproteobacteria bacterium]|jgi:DNA-binding MarR family transcriptional regulator|nr:hypothetical protein [Alphaproteobacteria bacterium]
MAERPTFYRIGRQMQNGDASDPASVDRDGDRPYEKSMASLLPQQRLLLELLIMSGDIAVADDIEGSILHRTLVECEGSGWVRRSRHGDGYARLSVTVTGRAQIKPREA